jgi:hypothetical protein
MTCCPNTAQIDPALGRARAVRCRCLPPNVGWSCGQSVVKIANIVILKMNEPPGTGGFGCE